MSLRTERLINNTIFYMLGMFATRILQFLFIPLYTKHISPNQYGYYDLILTILLLIIPIAYQSIWEAILRFIIDLEHENDIVLTTAAIYCGILTVFYIVIYYIFADLYDITYKNYILFTALGNICTYFWQFSARALKANKAFSLGAVICTAVTVLINFVLILVFNVGLESLFIANICGSFSMVLIIEMRIGIFKKVELKNFKIQLLTVMLRYSIPLFINAFSWWLINSANRFTILNKFSMEENGIYAMTEKFLFILNTVVSVFNMAWLEEAFREHNSKDNNVYFNRVLNILIRLIFSAILIILPLTYIFHQFIVFENYRSGIFLLPVLFLSAAFIPISAHLGSAFLARKESKYVFYTTLIAGLVTVMFGWYLADIIGLMGIAVSTLIGSILLFLIRIPLLRHKMYLDIDWQCICYTLLTYCFISYIFYKTNLGWNIFALFIGIIFALYYNRNLISILFKIAFKRS